jgi:hypothetical protein
MRPCTRRGCQQKAVGMLDGDFISMCPEHALAFWSERFNRVTVIVDLLQEKLDQKKLDLG